MICFFFKNSQYILRFPYLSLKGLFCFIKVIIYEIIFRIVLKDRLKAYISLRRSSLTSKVKIAGYVVVKCCLLFFTTWTRKDIFIMKLCRNLCWFSWLKFNLKRVSNFAPIMNVMLKMPCLIRDAKTKLVWWNLADNAQTSNILTL